VFADRLLKGADDLLIVGKVKKLMGIYNARDACVLRKKLLLLPLTHIRCRSP
jgi:hypothetical protein